MERILVTGADGFIGSHLVESLARAGCSVRAMAHYNSFDRCGWLDDLPTDVLDEVEVVKSDIRDRSAVHDAVAGCAVVLHLAALIAIPYSYRAAQSYVATNVEGTLNVLEAAKSLDVRKIVHTSTSEVYGTARHVPIGEDHPLQPQSPYAATKVGADCLALSYHASFGLPVAVLRPFNTYGPRQSTRAVIPTIVTQIAGGARSVRLGATHPTRDFNFVGDVVAGFLAAVDRDAAIGHVVNIGSNYEISIGETARLIADVMGRDITIEDDSERFRPEASEVDRLWADNTLAADLLGWRPSYGGRVGLRRGLEETAAWFVQPRNLAKYKVGQYTL